ncbi:MAG: DUF1801 domain-containing protein [Rhizobiales bacterium]|nr:DUF1801 domain-containing protein [Hyphomicrobiales bacterium]
MSEPDEIASVLATRPPKLRARLLELRRLILDVAASTPGVGPIEETLKWDQPSFLTSASKSGTTIRIDRLSKTDDRPALFVSCQTDLIARFKAIYPETLAYRGKRAIVLDAEKPLPEAALRHCIALALTYKRGRRATP